MGKPLVVEKSEAPIWGDEHLRLRSRRPASLLWSWHVDDDRFAMDQPGVRAVGPAVADKVSFEELSAQSTRPTATGFAPPLPPLTSVAGSYEIDFRNLSGADVRWISRVARAPTPASSIE